MTSAPQVEVVVLSEDDTGAAQALAEATYERFKDQPGHYGNTLPKHRLGKLAELAVEKYLRKSGIVPDSLFRDIEKSGDADLKVDDFGIEVKSWRPDTWEEWGRCVTPKQMRWIAAKSRAIVWTIVHDVGPTATVELVGWSLPEEVAATAIRMTGPDHRQVPNHQVDLVDIRPMADLITALRPA